MRRHFFRDEEALATWLETWEEGQKFLELFRRTNACFEGRQSVEPVLIVVSADGKIDVHGDGERVAARIVNVPAKSSLQEELWIERWLAMRQPYWVTSLLAAHGKPIAIGNVENTTWERIALTKVELRILEELK